VDIEMSFVTADDVMSALEEVFADAFAKMGVKMELPLRRISYWDAMDTYGIDKPDTRIGMELHDVTGIFAESGFKLFASAAAAEGQYVKAICAPGAGVWGRSKIDKLAPVAASFGAKGLAWVAFKEDGSVQSPIAKFLSEAEIAALKDEMGANPGDLILFAVGERLATDEILCGMRVHMANVLEVPREGHDFLWVVDFPLVHWDEERAAYAAELTPGTAAKFIGILENAGLAGWDADYPGDAAAGVNVLALGFDGGVVRYTAAAVSQAPEALLDALLALLAEGSECRVQS
jgi:aspartyl-tRNA synthetase